MPEDVAPTMVDASPQMTPASLMGRPTCLYPLMRRLHRQDLLQHLPAYCISWQHPAKAGDPVSIGSRHRFKEQSHGSMPTVADLAVPPAISKSTPRRVVTYPPKQLSLHSLLAPAAPKRSRSPPPLRLGGLLPPPPKARPLSLQPQRASPKALSQQMPPIAIHSPAAPLREPRLYPPRPRQVKISRTRQSLDIRKQQCGTHWTAFA